MGMYFNNVGQGAYYRENDHFGGSPEARVVVKGEVGDGVGLCSAERAALAQAGV